MPRDQVGVLVAHLDCSQAESDGVVLERSATEVLAFIDNITFHPVPEPGTLTLLALSLAALLIVRVQI